MRISLAKSHFQQALAASQQPAGSAANMTIGNAYELMLAKLAEDKRRLKGVQSVEKKAEVKAEILPDYFPWITGVLESDSGRQDDVLMTVFVWAIDTGDFTRALDIGAYAITHDLVMPDQYKRDVPCVLAEEIADYALKQPDGPGFALGSSIGRTIHLTDGKDMPDEVRAKLYKAYGYALRTAGELTAAKASLTRALELDTRVGVKKDIERLETLIKNSSVPVDAETPAKTEAS